MHCAATNEKVDEGVYATKNNQSPTSNSSGQLSTVINIIKKEITRHCVLPDERIQYQL